MFILVLKCPQTWLFCIGIMSNSRRHSQAEQVPSPLGRVAIQALWRHTDLARLLVLRGWWWSHRGHFTLLASFESSLHRLCPQESQTLGRVPLRESLTWSKFFQSSSEQCISHSWNFGPFEANRSSAVVLQRGWCLNPESAISWVVEFRKKYENWLFHRN